MFWRRWLTDSGNAPARRRFTEEELRIEIERLYEPGDDRERLRKLHEAGDQAVLALIPTLYDPRITSIRFDEGKRHWPGAKTPLDRIWYVLSGKNLPPSALDPLKRLLEHEEPDPRRHAAWLLAFMANVRCIEPVRQALADEDDHVRVAAMGGIRNAMVTKRGDDKFFAAVFDPLADLLEWLDPSLHGLPPQLLLGIDRRKALRVMVAPRYLSIENPAAHYVVRALNEIDHKIPHATLLPYLEQLRPRKDEHPYYYGYAEALRAYAIHPDRATKTLLLAERESRNDWIRAAAIEGLRKLGSA